MDSDVNKKIHVDYLQIGAHIGNTHNDKLFSKDLSNKTLVLVEPVDYLYRELQRNYKQHHPTANIFFVNAAVSNKDDMTVDLYVPSESNDFTKLPWWASQVASVRKDHVHTWIPSMKMEVRSVPCITLNRLCTMLRIAEVETLLIDTEGHDYDILMALDLSIIKPRHIHFENSHMDGNLTKGARYAHLLGHFLANAYVIEEENDEDTHLRLLV